MPLRISLLGAWSETERVSCSFFSASWSIFGTRPQVERLMFRIPMLTPSGEVMFSRNRITSSKLSSGSPMPMSTMWEMRSPMSFCAV